MNCSSLHRNLGVHVSFVRSTNLDSWAPVLLKMMSLGGNNRAHIFFKQHGWTDGGNIEAKYTSRSAELYRQILSKEVAKSFAEETDLLSPPLASQSMHEASGLPDVKIPEAFKEYSLENQENFDVSASPIGHSQTALTNSVKKPLDENTTRKTGGVGVWKLTTKCSQMIFMIRSLKNQLLQFSLQLMKPQNWNSLSPLASSTKRMSNLLS
uniref:Putative ADP-ribosylation factor GTPase-activating protein AGD8 n=1 Tax=Davidia involucrata TaxID=16924 RepID=A0A5B7BVS5_DAVIN